METTILSGDPGGVTALLKAALPSIPVVNQLPGVRKSGHFDGLSFTRPAVTTDRHHVAAYAGVCGFPVKDTLPVTYPHVLSFPLHLAILGDPDFPFPAMGTVHIANRIAAHRPIEVGETLTVTTRVDQVRSHPKGRQVDFETTVDAGGTVVWESTSTYLRRERVDATEGSAPEREPGPRHVVPGRVTWRFGGDLGRRYAAVAGDHNPIHLYSWTARPLGFSRPIVHGMCSLARCVAALENRLPGAVAVEASFSKPVLLPASVAFGQDATADGIEFALTSPGSGAPHVLGRTRAIG